MLYPTAEKWGSAQISDEMHKYFCLLWWEFFDDDTPDTWQVRTCNTRTVMQEIVDAAETAKTVDGYKHVLKYLIQEAISISAKDPVIAHSYPFVKRYLAPWVQADISGSNVGQIQRLGSVILRNLTDYREKAVARVRQLLLDSGNRKADLSATAMGLAVEIVARGYSTEHIQSLFLKHMFSTCERPFIDRFDDMMSALKGSDREFKCTFLVSGVSRDHGEALPSGFSVRIGPPEQIRNGPEEEFYASTSRFDVFVTVDVKATDPTAAWHRAEQRLSQAFAVLNLYGVNDQYSLKAHEALVECGDDVPVIALPSAARRQYLRNAKDRLGRAQRLSTVHARLNDLSDGDADQLMASLQYHRLSLTATSDEARFVNLWIALESLCQSGEGTLIERVTSKIAPCVAVGNIRKITVNLAIYLRFLWIREKTDAFLELFPFSTKKKVDPRDLLAILLDPDEAGIKALLDFARDHPVVLNRLYWARTSLFDRPSSIADNIRTNRKHIEWQLRRIYRVRNEIMHSGRSTPQLRQLIQHLHGYYVITIQALASELNRRPEWTIADAFEHRRLLFDHAMTFFESKDEQPISQATLLNLAECLQRQVEPYAWPIGEMVPTPSPSETIQGSVQPDGTA